MAYLRDRRAFGNIGTRKFRGARFAADRTITSGSRGRAI